MLVLTDRISPNLELSIDFYLPLTAEQRTRSRQSLTLEAGEPIYLRLPRGTVLNEGDLLTSATQSPIVQIIAQPEPVLTITAENQLDLIRAAYHLGNRHVAVEITSSYLKIAPDSVLQSMLTQLGLKIKSEVTPFYPESGAYGHHH